MTLPYPYEVETGALKRRHHEPRTSLDVVGHVHDAIRVRGDALEVFGVSLDVVAPESAPTVAEHLRKGVTDHFQERQSAPDADTWQSFASQAHDQLDGRTEVDSSTLRILRLTIDSL